MSFSDEIIKILEYICEKIGMSVDLASSQVQNNILPYLTEICQRYTALKITSNCVGIAIAIGLIITAIVMTRKCVASYRKANETKKDTWFYDYDFSDLNPAGFAAVAFAGVCIILGTVMFILSLCSLLNWIFVPEIQFFDVIKQALN